MRIEAYHEEEYKGWIIELWPDDDPISPRGWSNLGTMVCWHRDYVLGDEDHGFRSPEDFAEYLRDNRVMGLSLYLYDHSGLSMSYSREQWPFNCPWDCGQVGWIFVSFADIRKEYGCQRVSRKTREKVIARLQAEVEVYDTYLRCGVIGWSIRPAGDSDRTPEDSCWGYYSEDHALDDARDSIDFLSNRTMTPREYTANFGLKCPACRQGSIGLGLLEPGPDEISVEGLVECDDCGATWLNVYELASYKGLQTI